MGQSDCTHTHSSILNRQSVWRRELGTLPQECAPSLLSVKLHTHTHTHLLALHAGARRNASQATCAHVLKTEVHAGLNSYPPGTCFSQ